MRPAGKRGGFGDATDREASGTNLARLTRFVKEKRRSLSPRAPSRNFRGSPLTNKAGLSNEKAERSRSIPSYGAVAVTLSVAPDAIRNFPCWRLFYILIKNNLPAE